MIVSAILIAWPSALRAQPVPTSQEALPYRVASGSHDNSGTEESLAFSALIEATNGPILRIRFSEFHLGPRSYVTLTSVKDRGQQRLDSKSMPQWQNTSALFNGPSVLLQLHVAPGEKGVFVNVDQVVLHTGCGAPTKSAGVGSIVKTLCGSDDRVASSDFRVGRINGCTAWLVSNGAAVTAGQCSPLGGIFEVNVPASAADGTPVAANPIDQYPIDTNSVVSVNNGAGDDYAVFRLFPNSNTGQRAHQERGFFRVSREAPAAGNAIRVTGYGLDNTPAGPVNNCCARDTNGACTHLRCNAQSRTLQTATGPFTSEIIGGPNNAQHNYAADTEPASTGSPIIWDSNGFAIGIHTSGGCNGDGTGSNSGTSFENTGLENALQNFPGTTTRYLDALTYPNAPSPIGTIFQPFHDLSAAVAAVPSGGRISMVMGSYSKTNGNTGTFGFGNKAMTLSAPVGLVIIGN